MAKKKTTAKSTTSTHQSSDNGGQQSAAEKVDPIALVRTGNALSEAAIHCRRMRGSSGTVGEHATKKAFREEAARLYDQAAEALKEQSGVQS